MPAATDTIKEFVLDQLRGIRDLRAHRMFGAYGLYSGEKFFGIISKSRLYFKTDAKTRAAYLEREAAPFRPAPGMELKVYFEVPVDVLEDRDTLIQWASDAVSVASVRKGRKAKRGNR